MFISFAIVPLALAASALANVFLTAPTAATSWPAGQPATLAWQDNGEAPSLAQFGNATISIYVGNSVMQTPLQLITASVNVSALSTFEFTPDATIGPNSGQYFIRVTSLSYMNPSTPQYPEEAFSALFTLTGMSGTFNSSIQAEINGQSTAPIGGTSSASAASTATGATASVTTVASSSISTAASASSAASTPSTTPTSGAGKPVIATGFIAFFAAFVGASLL